MRAVVIPQHGGIDVLAYVEDSPTPQPGPGEALVRVHTAGVNQIDRVVRMGYPGVEIPLPHIIGADIAGVVVEMGPVAEGANASNASTTVVGTRVLAYPLLACGNCAL